LTDDSEEEERAAQDIPALFATVGYHLALIAGHATTGDDDHVKLAVFAKALRGLAGRAKTFSGARNVEPAAPVSRGDMLGRFLPRLATAEEVDAERTAGMQLREPI